MKRGRGRPIKCDEEKPDWTHILFGFYVQLATRYGYSKADAVQLAAEHFYPGQEKDTRDMRRLANQVRRRRAYRTRSFMFSGGSADQLPTLDEEIAQLERFLGPAHIPPRPL